MSTSPSPSSLSNDVDRPGGGSLKQHYLFLDGLRGLMSCYVAAYHFVAWVPSVLPRWITRLQRPLSFGHVSVSVFIVLSGFSLMRPVAQSPEKRIRGGIRAYLKRRAWRILPGYYAALLLSVAVALLLARAGDSLARESLSPASLVTHFLLIHNLFSAYAVKLNMAHWSVAAEWQIYFLMPLVLLPLWRWGGTGVMVFAGFALAAAPLVLLPKAYNLAWTCPWYIGLFAFGMAAATLDIPALRERDRRCFLLAVGALIGAYFAVQELSHSPGTERPSINFAKDAIAGGGVGALILYCLSAPLELGRRPILVRCLESRPLVTLGSASYSLYLTHVSVLDLILWVSHRYHWTDLSAFYFRTLIGLPLAVAVAFTFARFFEWPFMARRG